MGPFPIKSEKFEYNPTPNADELVIFQDSQALPLFIVHM